MHCLDRGVAAELTLLLKSPNRVTDGDTTEISPSNAPGPTVHAFL